jgi:hypothetical protein
LGFALRGFASLDGLAAIHENAFEIPEGDVGRGEHRRDASQEADAIVIRQRVIRVIRTHHDVANCREGDPVRQRR